MPVGALVGVVLLSRWLLVLACRRRPTGAGARPAPPRSRLEQHRRARPRALHGLRLPFEIAAVILLVAIIAAIALTQRTRRACAALTRRRRRSTRDPRNDARRRWPRKARPGKGV